MRGRSLRQVCRRGASILSRSLQSCRPGLLPRGPALTGDNMRGVDTTAQLTRAGSVFDGGRQANDNLLRSDHVRAKSQRYRSTEEQRPTRAKQERRSASRVVEETRWLRVSLRQRKLVALRQVQSRHSTYNVDLAIACCSARSWRTASRIGYRHHALVAGPA